MALTFPRDMTTGRRWGEARFRLARRQEFSRTRGGALIAADLGPPLWRADFRSFPLRRDAADALLADFETLAGAAQTFLAHPAERPRPASNAAGSGAVLGAVHTINAAAASLKIGGLPAGFVLSAGDFLSIATAAGGREFLRLAESGAAGGAGTSPLLAVTQPIRPSVLVGQVVTLSDPLVEMRLEPDTLDKAAAGLGWFEVAFSAWQVIR